MLRFRGIGHTLTRAFARPPGWSAHSAARSLTEAYQACISIIAKRATYIVLNIVAHLVRRVRNTPAHAARGGSTANRAFVKLCACIEKSLLMRLVL